MTLSKKILLGLILGIAAGLFLGEYAIWLKPVADGYVKLLQMTVLPYIMVSLLSKLGILSFTEVRTLAVRAGSVLAVGANPDHGFSVPFDVSDDTKRVVLQYYTSGGPGKIRPGEALHPGQSVFFAR
jgi:hypothetical protein